MSQKEFESSNITPPLANTKSMQCLAVLRPSFVTQSINLEQVFGNFNASHFYTLEADGAKVYVAFSGAPQVIDPHEATFASGFAGTVASGNERLSYTAQATGFCWPIPADQPLPFTVIKGNEGVSSGMPTGSAPTMPSYKYLNFRYPSGGSTGYLRIQRSSVGFNESSKAFPSPDVVGLPLPTGYGPPNG